MGARRWLALGFWFMSACIVPSYRNDEAAEGGAGELCSRCGPATGSAQPADAGSADPVKGTSHADGSATAAPFDGSLDGPEAGAVAVVTAPGAQTSWPDSMLGTYAVRVRFFGNDATLPTIALYSHEKIALAVVTRAGPTGPLSMKFTSCRDFLKFQSPLGEGLVATTAYPARLPPVIFSLVEHDGAFHTEAAPRLIGYQEQVPASCASASKAPKLPAQSWIVGAQCDCVAPTGPPTTTSDCRVIDPDSDGNPGLTIQLSGSSNGQDFVRFRDQSQLTAGKLGAGGAHTGLWLENNDYYQLQCASGICARTAYRACKPEVNPTVFAPLVASPAAGGAWTCDEVLRRTDLGELFPSEMLAFPDDC